MRPNLAKSTLTSAAAAVILLAGVAGTALAAADDSETSTRPFDGTFVGTAYGDRGSQAPLTLQMTQDGSDVGATVTLGDGLYVESRFCGGASVPGGTVEGAGQVDPANQKRVLTRSSFDVQGVPIGLAITGDLSEDGNTISAETSLDLPDLCGGDRVLVGTLDRAD